MKWVCDYYRVTIVTFLLLVSIAVLKTMQLKSNFHYTIGFSPVLTASLNNLYVDGTREKSPIVPSSVANAPIIILDLMTIYHH